jgi:aspartate carbamoyltransferase catalytic subunit
MLPRSLVSLAPGITLTYSIEEAVTDADVIMMLRVQLERQHALNFPKNEYYQFYGLQLEHLERARPMPLLCIRGRSTGGGSFLRKWLTPPAP